MSARFLSRRLPLILAFTLGCAALATAGPENMSDVTHQSTALGVSKTFRIYVPSNPAPGEKFFVIFVLHGWSDNYLTWDGNTNVEYLADAYRTILVFPDGGHSSWWLNSSFHSTYQYENYLIELVDLIDSSYPTFARREARAIMGFSMGGAGALRMAIRRPDLFSSASSLSGILKITNHPFQWNIQDRLGPFSTNFDSWTANSVYEQCHLLVGADVDLLLDCGTSDPTGALNEGRLTHDRMRAAGVDHFWVEVPGGHDWNYVQNRLFWHLEFHNFYMRRSLIPFQGISGFGLY